MRAIQTKNSHFPPEFPTSPVLNIFPGVKVNTKGGVSDFDSHEFSQSESPRAMVIVALFETGPRSHQMRTILRKDSDITPNIY